MLSALFPSELHLDGNDLQCSGTLALLRPLAEYAEMQGKDQPATASPHTGNLPLLPQGEPWVPLLGCPGWFLKGGFCFASRWLLSAHWRPGGVSALTFSTCEHVHVTDGCRVRSPRWRSSPGLAWEEQAQSRPF